MAEAAKKTTKPKSAAAKPAAAKAPKAAPAEPKAAAVTKTKARAESTKRAPGTAPAIKRPERKTRIGIVVSTKMQQTVVVKIERRVQHPLYGKVVLRTKRFKAQDVIGCDEGDRVEIMETRPISKEIRWRVSQILEKVK